MSVLNLKNRFHLKDLLSGVVVFLVALPLCLGIALASGAPIISGIIAGIVGGIIVGLLSGSHISVAGPAAGLTAVILVQLEQLGGNYAAFLLCIIFAGVLQIQFTPPYSYTFSNRQSCPMAPEQSFIKVAPAFSFPFNSFPSKQRFSCSGDFNLK